MPKKTDPSKLFNIIAEFGIVSPGFALFLGAGASVSSGVKPATAMIDDWREKYYVINCKTGEPKDEYLSQQPWFGKANEYGDLFESLYDLPAHRREYIEGCIKGSSPSWGYTYLANLLTRGYVNTVFTTNFDDLINDVCNKFASVPKPLVCAHDSSIDSVRLLSSRPKIIKLHGDFLFDHMKNTIRETSDLGRNMRDKFSEFAKEYGLIVIGYGGRDESVMAALQQILQEAGSFKNGIYWCVLANSQLPQRAESLSQDQRFHVVEIEGFDEFMAELNKHLGLGLPKELSAPYEALGDSLEQLLREAEATENRMLHPVIQKDQREVRKALQKIPPQVVPATLDFEKIGGFEFRVGKVMVKQAIPFGPIGEAHELAGNTEQALRFLALQIKHAPNPRAFTYVFNLLEKHNLVTARYEAFEKMLKASVRMFQEECATANELAIVLMRLGKWDDAKWVLDAGETVFKKSGDTNPVLAAYYKLNKMQIKVHTGEALTKKDEVSLQKMSGIEGPYVKMGVAILQQDWGSAESWLAECLVLGPAGRVEIDKWPIIELLRPHLKKRSVMEKLRKAK